MNPYRDCTCRPTDRIPHGQRPDSCYRCGGLLPEKEQRSA